MIKLLKNMASHTLSLSIGMTLIYSTAFSVEPFFVANFDGPGGGTGGSANLVQVGGTGSLLYNQTVVSVSLEDEPIMGAGNFLKVTIPNWQSVGMVNAVTFVPESNANSWAAMMDISSNEVSLKGGFDFFVRPESIETYYVTNWFRPLDLGSRSEGGIRLVLNMLDDGRLMLSLISGNRSFIVEGEERGQVNVAVEYSLTAGLVHHIGATFDTDHSGTVTMSLFAQAGEGAMKTNYANGSQEFTINPEVVTVGLPAGDFGIAGGIYGPDLSERVLEFDSFRLYGSPPKSFPAIGK